MRNVETCTITIRMEENFDLEECGGYNRFDPETIVKETWQRMVAFFTERRGVRSGELTLDGGHTVTIGWKYETEYEPPTQEEMGGYDVTQSSK